MDKESLEKIKKIFKSLNDKLAKIEDPALYGRKRTAKYNVVDRQIDNVKSNDNAVNNALNDINEKLDEHDNILEDHADKLDELQNNKNEIVPIKDDAAKIEPPKDPTEEELGATNLRYNEKTERFHENEGPRKNLMVSRAEALNRVEEHKSKNATAEPSDEPSDENSILEEIHSNLIKINESLSSVLSLSTNKPPTDAEPVDSDGKEKIDGQEPKAKGGMGGLLGGASKLLQGIAFTLFAIYPLVLAWIREKREKISEFLMPVFDFIFESAIPFFTEKLPKFFMEDIPEYFSEKFDVVKDFASDFIGDIKKVIAGIQKTVGETIVSLADKLPDGPFDVLKNMKKGLKDFGEGLISDADNTITEVDKEQVKTQAKREEKKKRDILLKQADDEGKRVVELNKAKGYKGYEVKPDFEKGLVKIEYKVDKLDGVSDEFDANKSMESETLIKKTGGSSGSVKADNGGAPVKDGEGKSDAASSGGTPEPTTSSSTGGNGATTSGGAGGQAEGGTATPELNQTTAGNGNALDINSKENENAFNSSKNSAPPVVNIPSTGRKVRMLPGQGPHDINDVPDPTPFLGEMAKQLFYRIA